MVKSLVLFLATLTLLLFWAPGKADPDVMTNLIEYSFDNYVDHFDYTRDDTYQQRYYVNTDFWTSPDNPVFFFLCTSAICNTQFVQMTTGTMVMGANMSALIIVVEMRYFGYSQPTDDWSTENMVYLTNEQITADTAYFI